MLGYAEQLRIILSFRAILVGRLNNRHQDLSQPR
jgi:hypothetical protein